jgi:hypothetical protein
MLPRKRSPSAGSNKKEHLRVGTERPQAQAQQNSRYPTLQTHDRKNCFLDHLVPSRQVKGRQSFAKEEHKSGVCFLSNDNQQREAKYLPANPSPVAAISLSLLHAPTSIILLYIGARISPSMCTKVRHRRRHPTYPAPTHSNISAPPSHWPRDR